MRRLLKPDDSSVYQKNVFDQQDTINIKLDVHAGGKWVVNHTATVTHACSQSSAER